MAITYKKKFNFGVSNDTVVLTDNNRKNTLKNTGFKGSSSSWESSDLIKSSEFNYLFKSIDQDLINYLDLIDQVEVRLGVVESSITNMEISGIDQLSSKYQQLDKLQIQMSKLETEITNLKYRRPQFKLVNSITYNQKIGTNMGVQPPGGFVLGKTYYLRLYVGSKTDSNWTTYLHKYFTHGPTSKFTWAEVIPIWNSHTSSPVTYPIMEFEITSGNLIYKQFNYLNGDTLVEIEASSNDLYGTLSLFKVDVFELVYE